jgi:uncharacterized membrane protein YdjX (TVP38/TMEM64 family)
MTNKTKNNIWIKPLILILIVGGLTSIFYKLGLIHFFLNKEKLHSFLDNLGAIAFIGFILLQAAQVVAAPIPGEVTGILGGFLYGPFLGVILSTIGLTIGSFIAFTLSKTFGRPLVDRFVDKSTLGRFDYLIHHKGAFLVFLLFLIPGFPKDYLCYILGLGHLSTKTFLLIGGTGRLFGTVLLTLGGDYIRHHQYGKFSILVGVALVVVFIAMAYRDKIERLFRILHIKEYKRKKAKESGKQDV